MMKKRISKNILTAKEKLLNSLIDESQEAVSLITEIVGYIEKINTKIIDTRQEIETFRSELDRLDGSMEQQYAHNTKFINKFQNSSED